MKKIVLMIFKYLDIRLHDLDYKNNVKNVLRITELIIEFKF